MRISANALLTETGQCSQFRMNRSRMPLTAATLEQLAESYQDFAVRRIWQVAHTMHGHGVAPRRYVLVEAAGVKRLQADPSVQAAIDAALAWLQVPAEGAPGDNFISDPPLTQEIFA